MPEDRSDSRSQDGDGSGAGSRAEGGVRIPLPSVHRPCVIVIGLFGLMRVGILFLEPDPVVNLIFTTLFVVPIALHAIWLHALFRDGRQHLRDALPLDAGRVVMVLLFSCFFAELWTVAALGILYKVTQARVASSDPHLERTIGRYAEELRTLLILGTLDLIVLFGVGYFMLSRAAGLDSEDALSKVAPRAILGTWGALTLALFALTITSCYLWFVVRATPALYRGFAAAREPKA